MNAYFYGFVLGIELFILFSEQLPNQNVTLLMDTICVLLGHLHATRCHYTTTNDATT